MKPCPNRMHHFLLLLLLHVSGVMYSEAARESRCLRGEKFPDPKDCRSFYECTRGRLERKTCPWILHFDSRWKSCVPAFIAKCKDPETADERPGRGFLSFLRQYVPFAFRGRRKEHFDKQETNLDDSIQPQAFPATSASEVTNHVGHIGRRGHQRMPVAGRNRVPEYRRGRYQGQVERQRNHFSVEAIRSRIRNYLPFIFRKRGRIVQGALVEEHVTSDYPPYRIEAISDGFDNGGASTKDLTAGRATTKSQEAYSRSRSSSTEQHARTLPIGIPNMSSESATLTSHYPTMQTTQWIPTTAKPHEWTMGTTLNTVFSVPTKENLNLVSTGASTTNQKLQSGEYNQATPSDLANAIVTYKTTAYSDFTSEQKNSADNFFKVTVTETISPVTATTPPLIEEESGYSEKTQTSKKEAGPGNSTTHLFDTATITSEEVTKSNTEKAATDEDTTFAVPTEKSLGTLSVTENASVSPSTVFTSLSALTDASSKKELSTLSVNYVTLKGNVNLKETAPTSFPEAEYNFSTSTTVQPVLDRGTGVMTEITFTEEKIKTVVTRVSSEEPSGATPHSNGALSKASTDWENENTNHDAIATETFSDIPSSKYPGSNETTAMANATAGYENNVSTLNITSEAPFRLLTGVDSPATLEAVDVTPNISGNLIPKSSLPEDGRTIETEEATEHNMISSPLTTTILGHTESVVQRETPTSEITIGTMSSLMPVPVSPRLHLEITDETGEFSTPLATTEVSTEVTKTSGNPSRSQSTSSVSSTTASAHFVQTSYTDTLSTNCTVPDFTEYHRSTNSVNIQPEISDRLSLSSSEMVDEMETNADTTTQLFRTSSADDGEFVSTIVKEKHSVSGNEDLQITAKIDGNDKQRATTASYGEETPPVQYLETTSIRNMQVSLAAGTTGRAWRTSERVATVSSSISSSVALPQTLVTGSGLVPETTTLPPKQGTAFEVGTSFTVAPTDDRVSTYVPYDDLAEPTVSGQSTELGERDTSTTMFRHKGGASPTDRTYETASEATQYDGTTHVNIDPSDVLTQPLVTDDENVITASPSQQGVTLGWASSDTMELGTAVDLLNATETTPNLLVTSSEVATGDIIEQSFMSTQRETNQPTSAEEQTTEPEVPDVPRRTDTTTESMGKVTGIGKELESLTDITSVPLTEPADITTFIEPVDEKHRHRIDEGVTAVMVTVLPTRLITARSLEEEEKAKIITTLTEDMATEDMASTTEYFPYTHTKTSAKPKDNWLTPEANNAASTVEFFTTLDSQAGHTKENKIGTSSNTELVASLSGVMETTSTLLSTTGSTIVNVGVGNENTELVNPLPFQAESTHLQTTQDGIPVEISSDDIGETTEVTGVTYSEETAQSQSSASSDVSTTIDIFAGTTGTPTRSTQPEDVETSVVISVTSSKKVTDTSEMLPNVERAAPSDAPIENVTMLANTEKPKYTAEKLHAFNSRPSGRHSITPQLATSIRGSRKAWTTRTRSPPSTAVFPSSSTTKITVQDNRKSTANVTDIPVTTTVGCEEEYGLFLHPNDCGLFVHCSDGVPYVKKCPGKLHFNRKLGVCDYPYRAGCQETATKR